MFKSYLKKALRNIGRNKGFTTIKIYGLANGIACCIVTLLFVQSALSFDKFHKNADRIYRLVPNRKMPPRTSFTTKTNSWIATQMTETLNSNQRISKKTILTEEKC